MALVTICQGIISLNVEGAALCSTGWESQLAAVPFDSSQLDTSVIVAVFSGGFLLYITPWAAAYGVSQLLKLMR